MKKLKYLAGSVVFFGALVSINAQGEYYEIKSRDALSNIAERKIVRSNLPVSLEQVMLTIYKLNPDAFVGGNIDRLQNGVKIYIPDNVADFVQISKQDAIAKLNDRNYLRNVYSEAQRLKLSGERASAPVGGNNAEKFEHILHVLDDHHQNIEVLKLENAHLNKSFKLLERALGRVVVIQGLLTSDVVKVKSQIYNGQAEGQAGLMASSANIANSKEGLNENSLKEMNDAGIDLNQARAELDKQAAEISQNPLSLANNAKTDVQAADPQQKVVNAPVPNKPQTTPKAFYENEEFWWNVATGAAILVPLLILLLWLLDFRQMRSKLMSGRGDNGKFGLKERMVPGFDSLGSSASGTGAQLSESSLFQTANNVTPLKKGKSADSMLDVGGAGLLEQLDMCLLCGDYQQAHTLTLKALSDNKNSPILGKKLAFIERKLGKAQS